MEYGSAIFSFGLRSTKYSVLKNPVVPVPSSGRPTWLVTTVTSGNEARMSRGLGSAHRTPSQGRCWEPACRGPRWRQLVEVRQGIRNQLRRLSSEKDRQGEGQLAQCSRQDAVINGPANGDAIFIAQEDQRGWAIL